MRRGRRTRHDRTTLHAILAVTVLIVAVVIGYVSFNALRGLPFQYPYHVTVLLPNADRLIAEDDVRVGGVRVGEVETVRATTPSVGVPPSAQVKLAIQGSVGQLQVDTIATVRAASALGATYVQLALGRSRRTIPNGGTLPLSHARTTVAVTDLFQIFNGNAGRSFQSASSGLAAALAGRGEDLNATIGSLADLFPPLGRVAAALASPQAQLPGFLQSLDRTSAALSKVRPQLAGIITDGATTFGALASVRTSLGETISAAPATESAATTAFISVRPGLDGLARLADALEPAAHLLPSSVGVAETAAGAGVGPLRELPGFTSRLRSTLSTLQAVSRPQATGAALRGLGELVSPLQTTLLSLLPAQQHCNIVGIATQNFASFIGSLGSGSGPGLVALGLATIGVPGDTVQSPKPSPSVHIDNMPVENAQRCDAGNEPFTSGKMVLSPPTGTIPNDVPTTSPPPGVLARAKAVGLLAPNPPTP